MTKLWRGFAKYMRFSEAARAIGFSTGALALSDWRKGLDICRAIGVDAIELSALRLPELEPLVNEIDSLDLSSFSYISVHLPSGFAITDEEYVIRCVERIAKNNWPLILHPDVISKW